MGRIVMMMKVIIVAIHLCRTDVDAQSRPPFALPHVRKLSLPQTPMRACRYEHARHALAHEHRLRSIRWLAATAQHSSWQLAADAKEPWTTTPTAPPPPPPASLLCPC